MILHRGGRSTPTWADPDPESRLLVDGAPACALWVARTASERRTGLLGTDGLDGALWLEPCSSVHTIGMRYPIDVVFLTRTGVARAVVTMRPGRIGRPRAARTVVELPSGAAARLGITPGILLSRTTDSTAAR